ncbi:outer membrane protein assembly factor BamB family protein [Thalassoroseus pseudoceratinae]|uniref:outer membrane protein assembly factor BamB family protein n=1 Tax=Thalassoroseus pseudoceratinae TaxID=2713176 RepID=UPI00142029EA|nr:PQQ-binding-like beta-propeller repeat protein [Thalassoroseus pseudoceratinae]
MSRCVLVSVVVIGISASRLSADWPEFRGANNDGHSKAKSAPLEWSSTANVAWRVELPGNGNGSPVVADGKVFITWANPDGRERSLGCFAESDGKRIWSKTVDFDEEEPTHKTNPYAPTTPAVQGDRVVVWHGSAGLFCYDLSGKLIWQRDLGKFIHIWGFGSSPIVHNETVYLNAGPGERQFVVAFDLKSGDELWRTNEPGGASGLSQKKREWVGSWGTPVVAQVEGEGQLIVGQPKRVVAYDLKSGEIRWFVGGLEQKGLVYTSPMISESDGIGVVMGGFRGTAIGFRLGGNGDVTETNQLWQVKQGNPQRIGSGVILGESIYSVGAGPGVVQCIELNTGKERWKARAKSFWGSIVAVGDRLYATDQDGTTHVFAADPNEYRELAINPLGEPSNSTPAITNGQVVIRTAKSLFCIRE